MSDPHPQHFDSGPFDPDELVRWAEMYGHPELWCQKAQALHVRLERLRELRAEQLAGRVPVSEFFDRFERIVGA